MKTIILDGNNIIRTYYMGPGNVFDFEREIELSNRLIQIASSSRQADSRVEVYFDGPKRGIYSQDDLVEVLFSGAKKADDLIVNTVAELVENYRQEVIVVTQDHQLQERCKAYGAEIKTTFGFLSEFYDCFEGAPLQPAFAM